MVLSQQPGTRSRQNWVLLRDWEASTARQLSDRSSWLSCIFRSSQESFWSWQGRHSSQCPRCRSRKSPRCQRQDFRDSVCTMYHECCQARRHTQQKIELQVGASSLRLPWTRYKHRKRIHVGVRRAPISTSSEPFLLCYPSSFSCTCPQAWTLSARSHPRS